MLKLVSEDNGREFLTLAQNSVGFTGRIFDGIILLGVMSRAGEAEEAN